MKCKCEQCVYLRTCAKVRETFHDARAKVLEARTARRDAQAMKRTVKVYWGTPAE